MIEESWNFHTVYIKLCKENDTVGNCFLKNNTVVFQFSCKKSKWNVQEEKVEH